MCKQIKKIFDNLKILNSVHHLIYVKIESCKDDPNAQCELYNATALCDPNGVYYAWARSSCPDYCGLCQCYHYVLIKIKDGINFISIYFHSSSSTFIDIDLSQISSFLVRLLSNNHPFGINCF